MVRPFKDDTLKKTKKVSFRINDSLYEVLSERAQRSGITISEYVTNLILNKTPNVHYDIVVDSSDIQKQMNDLGKIGSNLNQIAHYLNSGNPIDQSIKEELMESIEDIRGIRKTLNTIVRRKHGNR